MPWDSPARHPILQGIVPTVLAIGLIAAAVFGLVIASQAAPRDRGPRVQVAFSKTTPILDGFTFQVAVLTLAGSMSSYRVSLQVNYTSADIPTSPPGLIDGPLGFTFAPVLGGAYTVQYTDPTASGRLVVGGQFTVPRTGGPLPAGAVCTVYLLWEDGSALASAAWP